MDKENYTIRDYKRSDYKVCETLVNQAWKFDTNIQPRALAEIAKTIYTKGSLLNSNFQKVIEKDGKVIGLLFGLNEKIEKKKSDFLFGLNILRRIFFIKGLPFKKKTQFLKSLNRHVTNRSKLVEQGKSEIVLFIIDTSFQKQGYGKRLLEAFLQQCKESDVDSLIVETNTDGGSKFYKKMGFKLIDYFDSPLHSYVTRKGKACMYEYKY